MNAKATPTKALVARRQTDATVTSTGSAAEALGRPHGLWSRSSQRDVRRKSATTDGSWTSSAPASTIAHESRWCPGDVDYSASPRKSYAIAAEVKAARRASSWQAAADAVTPEGRQAVVQHNAKAGAAVAYQSSGIGVAVCFNCSESPSTGAVLAQRYTDGRQHEVEMHKAVASPSRAKSLVHPKAQAHASAARRSGAHRVRHSEEQKRTSSRATDTGSVVPRANPIGRATWIMGDNGQTPPVQPAASRKNANSPGFCLG